MLGGSVEIVIREIPKIIGACDHISEFLGAHIKD
jgi:hypothetical protein